MSTAGKLNRQSGFTLIELAVVVLLIALFAGLSIPLLSGLGDDALGASSRRLAGTIKYLYNEAALSQRPHRLVYNIDQGSYRAQRQDERGEWSDVEGVGREQRLKGSVRIKDLSLPGRGSFSIGEVTTAILPIGWVEATVIHLIDDDKQEITLRITSLTGATRVYEGYRMFE